MRRFLFWLSGLFPCRLIKQNDTGDIFLERYYLGRLFGKLFYLHRFTMSDPGRGLHDHPWSKAWSFERASGTKRKRFSLLVRSGKMPLRYPARACQPNRSLRRRNPMAYACNYCADTKRVKYQNFDGTTSEGHCPNCSAIAADGSPLSLSTPAVKPDFIFAAEKRREWGLRMLERDGRDMVSSLRMFSQAISLHNALWEIDIETGEQLKPNVDQMFMLIISEISEAFEGYRKNLLDTHLKHRSAMEAELADALVRILHMGVRFGLDVPGAAVEKCLYNVTRPDHQYEARIANHGKKF